MNTSQKKSAKNSAQKSKNTASRDPHIDSPRLFFDIGNKKIPITDEHLALFSENHHLESLDVLLAVVAQWEHSSIKETIENHEPSIVRELTVALMQDLTDYVRQACTVLATYPSGKRIDNVEKANGCAV